MYQRLLRPLAVVALGATFALTSCSDPSPSPVDGDLGAIGLELQSASGLSFSSFAYSISGPGGFSKNGTIDVSGSSTLSTVISPLPPGSGFSISLTGTGSDGTSCAGNAGFMVAARATTTVIVHLQCHEPARTGGVLVGATINVCAAIDGVAAMQAEVAVGASAQLMATAHDLDGGPSPLAYHWTSTGGTLAGATTATPTLTCTTAGPVTVTLDVTDGDCGDSLPVTITCTGAPKIVINEVESNGGVPGDWVELYNAGTAAADISGWKFKDNDDTHAFYVIPAGTMVPPGGYYLLEEAQFVFGLGAADSARLFDAAGNPVDSYSWTTHAAITYGRCPNGAGPFVSTGSSTKGAANDCSVMADAGVPADAAPDVAPASDTAGPDAAATLPQVVINEVESSGGVPGDWAELYNAGTTSADISGWKFKDNDDSHAFCVIPAGTIVPPGGFYVLEEAQFVFGLGAPDSTRLFDPAGNLVDSYSWTAHATTTYGRCLNGTGAFVTTGSSTKGAPNDCGGATADAGADSATIADAAPPADAGPDGAASFPWPGTDPVVTVDVANTFGTNLSGLNYQPAAGGAPAVLWAVQNGPSKIYRLLWDGTNWVPDSANGWSAGKLLHYPGGVGAPDSEGISKAEWADNAIYVSTERDNNNSGVSRPAVLRFDTSATGTELTAINDWNMTADLPVVGANLGLEAITYVPDTALVAGGFVDESTHAAYNPASYPNHGTGIFFVGLEGNGVVYAYALDHVASTFTRVATFASGQVSIMDLAYDRETGDLWGYCDNTCGNKATVFRLDSAAMSPTAGRFQIGRVFDHPASLPNSNNEGISFAPLADCAGGQRAFFWSDDDQLDGHAIRRGSIPCGPAF